MTPANDNVALRPKEIDQKIMAYRPGLRRLASVLGFRGEEADDLVTDTIMYCLENWRSYREDGAFWSWLFWSMRGVVSNRAKGAKVRSTLVFVQDSDAYWTACLPSNQEDYADLSAVLGRLTGLGGSILLRRALGDGLKEISDEIGLSMERVRQIEVCARTRVVAGKAA